MYVCSHFKVNSQQPRSGRLRPIQKIPTPIKLLISPLPEMINQICKKYSLENSQDKKTSDDTCDIFSEVTPENESINSLPVSQNAQFHKNYKLFGNRNCTAD